MPCSFKIQEYDKEIGCRFNVTNDELLEFDGLHWCEFHLPMNDKTGNQSVKSDWSKEKITEFNQKIFSIIDEVSESNNKNAIVDLRGIVFPALIDFSNKVLPRIQFDKATFSGDTSFAETTFIGPATFEETTFSKIVTFRKATFNDRARFTKSTFSTHVEFGKVIFNNEAWFERATFSDCAWFDMTIFNGCAVFVIVTFRNDARFWKTTFNKNASFNQATFSGDAYFDADTELNQNSNESSGSFFQGIHFDNAKFFKQATFMNRKFKGPTSFKYCYFEKAPKFHNCDFHQDTDFNGVVFNDKTSEAAPRAYRTLKLSMEKTRARDEQARFYALEQQSIRHQKETQKTVKMFSWFYEKTSDYGRSLLRPLVGLMMTFFVSFAFYGYQTDRSQEAMEKTRDFTVMHVVRPFSAWTKNGKEAINEFAPTKVEQVQYIATVQSLLSIIFIALFILALRWRFKRG